MRAWTIFSSKMKSNGRRYRVGIHPVSKKCRPHMKPVLIDGSSHGCPALSTPSHTPRISICDPHMTCCKKLHRTCLITWVPLWKLKSQSHSPQSCLPVLNDHSRWYSSVLTHTTAHCSTSNRSDGRTWQYGYSGKVGSCILERSPMGSSRCSSE